MRRALIAFGAVSVLVAGAETGCGGTPSAIHGPETAVAELAAALRAGDAAVLAARTGATPASIAASESTNGRELNALGVTLAEAPVATSARVSLSDGGAITLVREGESWRVDRGVLGRPSLSRPVDAVIALHEALARGRVRGVLSFFARAPRAELELELTRWLEGTADPDALEISVQGESATVTTPTGEHLQLVRESGEWHVVGF